VLGTENAWFVTKTAESARKWVDSENWLTMGDSGGSCLGILSLFRNSLSLSLWVSNYSVCIRLGCVLAV
jgi:hypothetical protein